MSMRVRERLVCSYAAWPREKDPAKDIYVLPLSAGVVRK